MMRVILETVDFRAGFIGFVEIEINYYFINVPEKTLGKLIFNNY